MMCEEIAVFISIFQPYSPVTAGRSDEQRGEGSRASNGTAVSHFGRSPSPPVAISLTRRKGHGR